MKQARYNEIKQIYKDSGAHLLTNEALEISLNPETVVSDFLLLGLEATETELTMSDSLADFISLSSDQQLQPKILLAHYPQFFERYTADESTAPHLTLSGHNHGGAIYYTFFWWSLCTTTRIFSDL